MKTLRNLLEKVVFSSRPFVILIFIAITCFLGYKATFLKIDAGFIKQLPYNHPYIKVFMKHQAEFGGANRIIISVEPESGTIYTQKFFEVFKKISDEAFFIPGVNRSSIQSLFTPNVRFTEIVDGGFAGGKVVPADFNNSPEHIETVRKNVLKSSIIGRLVANDFTAAAVSLQLSDEDPATGQKLNNFKVAKALEENIRKKYEVPGVRISIIGFAKAVGDIKDGAIGVLLFLGLSIVLIGLLVYYFIKSWRFTFLLIFCSLIAVVWNLGMLPLMGQGLDPMSILVPFLICAIGVSHGIQIINGVNFSINEIFSGERNEDDHFENVDTEELKANSCYYASKNAFNRLVMPGVVALISDTIGFVTIYLIEIPIIQEMATTASMGVLGLILTNMILLPVLLSYLKVKPSHAEKIQKSYHSKQALWKTLSGFADKRFVPATLTIALVLYGLSYFKSQEIKIGDMHAGVPELKQDSRYNVDTSRIVDKYSIGVDILNVIVETKNDACIDHSVMKLIDDFHWEVSNNPNVQSALSLPYVAKIISAGWSEGHFKWRELSRNSQNLVQAISRIETSTGLLNSTCSVMPVMIFSKDHKAESIKSIVATINDFKARNPRDDVKFELATGNVGVMAATNDTVADAQFKILLWIYGCIVILCMLLFRSIRSTLCIVLPLSLVSFMAYALMAFLEIGLKTSTLPVAAFGVGIGVDYGIYIFSQLSLSIKAGEKLSEAYTKTLDATGNAVLVTGLTLALSVSTWVFSDLKFQADMGILFAFMLLFNMIGAICLIPGLAWLLYPKNR